MLRENEKRIQCSMHVLHSSGEPHRWYCIDFIRNVPDMIYKRVTRLQASAGDCVVQPYHPPSDLIVTLLPELAELETSVCLRRAWVVFSTDLSLEIHLVFYFICGVLCVCVLCLWPTSLFSLSAAVQCLPLRGRLCLRWPWLHECKCWSPPFPPVLWRNRNNFF